MFQCTDAAVAATCKKYYYIETNEKKNMAQWNRAVENVVAHSSFHFQWSTFFVRKKEKEKQYQIVFDCIKQN